MICWHAQSDVFYFLASPLNVTCCTKRDLLSEIAKLFDPAGWLTPSIIIVKIIMQQIWLDKTDWAEEISLMECLDDILLLMIFQA